MLGVRKKTYAGSPSSLLMFKNDPSGGFSVRALYPWKVFLFLIKTVVQPPTPSNTFPNCEERETDREKNRQREKENMLFFKKKKDKKKKLR